MLTPDLFVLRRIVGVSHLPQRPVPIPPPEHCLNVLGGEVTTAQTAMATSSRTPGLEHGVRDRKALAYNPRAVSDLLDLRVEPQTAVAVLRRSRPLDASTSGDPAGGRAGVPVARVR
jgi:hypothetical protein